MSTRNYQAFGLSIESAVDLPELTPGSGSVPDVTISMGIVPENLLSGLQEYPVVPGVLYQASADRFLLKIERVARYLIRNGNEIIFQASPNADVDVINLFLTGSAFGALLLQRGLLPLHGSAVATPKGAVLFVGPSGNGKSTIAGALHQRGYPVLSDDVSAIFTAEGVPQVLPAYPRLLLWADAVHQLDATEAGLRPAHARQEKYQFPIHSEFPAEALPLHAIYVLSPVVGNKLELTTLTGFAKLQSLIDNTYRLQFLSGMGLHDWHFSKVCELAKHVHVALAERPIDSYILNALADLLENDFLGA